MRKKVSVVVLLIFILGSVSYAHTTNFLEGYVRYNVNQDLTEIVIKFSGERTESQMKKDFLNFSGLRRKDLNISYIVNKRESFMAVSIKNFKGIKWKGDGHETPALILRDFVEKKGYRVRKGYVMSRKGSSYIVKEISNKNPIQR